MLLSLLKKPYQGFSCDFFSLLHLCTMKGFGYICHIRHFNCHKHAHLHMHEDMSTHAYMHNHPLSVRKSATIFKVSVWTPCNKYFNNLQYSHFLHTQWIHQSPLNTLLQALAHTHTQNLASYISSLHSPHESVTIWFSWLTCQGQHNTARVQIIAARGWCLCTQWCSCW